MVFTAVEDPQETLHTDQTIADTPALTIDTKDEVRLFACLDRSSSMLRFNKVALVADQYPRALRDLEASATKVETWWLAHDLSCFGALAPVSEAPVPSAAQYGDAIAAGSAIADCLMRAIERAEAVRKHSGHAPIKAVIWTDGWNRHSRQSPRGTGRDGTITVG